MLFVFSSSFLILNTEYMMMKLDLFCERSLRTSYSILSLMSWYLLVGSFQDLWSFSNIGLGSFQDLWSFSNIGLGSFQYLWSFSNIGHLLTQPPPPPPLPHLFHPIQYQLQNSDVYYTKICNYCTLKSHLLPLQGKDRQEHCNSRLCFFDDAQNNQSAQMFITAIPLNVMCVI